MTRLAVAFTVGGKTGSPDTAMTNSYFVWAAGCGTDTIRFLRNACTD
ncbi:hypothetical protein N9L06_04995 [Mariniblastus sp.]|nr:hypothetical protein [Mariniblastus sp.]